MKLWTVGPFAAVLEEVYIWGRGPRDDKNASTANLVGTLLLKRTVIPLVRHIIFPAESGEETDLTDVGLHFIITASYSRM